MKHGKTINGNVEFNREDDYTEVESIGGSLYCSGADTRAAFPELRSRGDAAAACAAVRRAFMRGGFLFCDGILARRIAGRCLPGGTVAHRVVIVGQTKQSWCLETRDAVFAHGESLRQARESLVYKAGNRDTSAYAGWTPDTVVTRRKAIESYRVITGTCESGTRRFVESVERPKARYAVREIVEMTKGRFGHDAYAAFFSK